MLNTHKYTIEDNIITLKFSEIPTLSLRNQLKKIGFVYNRSGQHWNSPATEECVALVKANIDEQFRNCVITGNCVEVLETLPDACANLVVTDPPYLINYRDRTGRSIKNDDNALWVEPTFKHLYRILQDKSYCVVFCALPSLVPFITAAQQAGFRTLGQIIWNKSYASSSYHLAFHHEQALVMVKGYPTKPLTPLKSVQPWKYTGNTLHPTQKHVDILTPLIESFSNHGDMVLDPFCGSGSTLEAAKISGRAYCGIDLDAGYARIARNRVNKIS